jgi:predicted Zn-dependent protease
MRLSLSHEELFQQGCEAFEERDFQHALRSFQKAHAEEPTNATYLSYYGLCIGLATRDFERASELCRAAAKQEFFNPEQYLNLARVYLSFGFKAEGVRYLRRGQMIDPAHPGIANQLEDLGQRGQPVLAFLPRRHLINRWLGIARHLLVREPGDQIAA